MCVSTYNYGEYVTDTTVMSLISDTVDTTVPLPLVCPIAVYKNSLASQLVGWCQFFIEVSGWCQVLLFTQCVGG